MSAWQIVGFGTPVIIAVAGVSAFAWIVAGARRKKEKSEGVHPILGVVPPKKRDEE
jgi:hypothetical protein